MKSKMLAKKLLAVLKIASLVFLVGCGGTTGQSINQPPAGVTVSPASATVQTELILIKFQRREEP